MNKKNVCTIGGIRDLVNVDAFFVVNECIFLTENVHISCESMFGMLE